MDIFSLIISVAFLTITITFLAIVLYRSIKKLNRIKLNKRKKEKLKFLSKGEKGEYLVDQMLKDICFYEGGYCYKELKLEDIYRNWCEIDNIYIGPSGIYIIETKNRCGQITIDEETGEWIQTNGDYQCVIPDPVIQSQRHAYFFARMFKEFRVIKYMVIFVEGDISQIDDEHVFDLNTAEDYITGQKRVYSDTKVDYINNKVKKYAEHPTFTHYEYKKWISRK